MDRVVLQKGEMKEEGEEVAAGGIMSLSCGGSWPSITWLLSPLTDFCQTIGSRDQNQIIKRSRLALFSCHMC